ncbi:glycosyl transferase family group 2-domain-containing protein [Mycena amicta]|nr:glycosyl transferase family group 2-domain-containing protein [Mycena amicta]
MASGTPYTSYSRTSIGGQPSPTSSSFTTSSSQSSPPHTPTHGRPPNTPPPNIPVFGQRAHVPSQLGVSSAWGELSREEEEEEEEEGDEHYHEAERIQVVDYSPLRPPAPVTILTSDYDEVDALLHAIYEKTQQDAWFAPGPGALADASLGGVAIRISAPVSVTAGAEALNAPADSSSSTSSTSEQQSTQQAEFRLFPYNAPHLVPFEAAVRALNPAGAVLVRNASVTAAVGKVPLSAQFLDIDSETRIQEKDQRAAFIRTPPSLVLWSPQVESLGSLYVEFEEKLFKYIWRTRTSVAPSVARRERERDSMAAPGVLASLFGGGTVGTPTVEEEMSEVDLVGAMKEAASDSMSPAAPPAKPSKGGFFGWSWRLQPRAAQDQQAADPEKAGSEGGKDRKLVLLGPFYAGCGAALAAYFVFAGISVLLEEYALDGNATRFVLVLTLPVIFCVSIFFCLQLVGNISLILGPVSQYHENSAYYSAVKPAPNPAVDNKLPHVTIQCPVYKESLKETIAPSVLSVKKAMQTYARQGGTSSIFICDDGMQIIDEDLRKERMEFYANHNIGWVARPKHGKDGFFRKGKFKKASNMNYGLGWKHLAALEAAGATDTESECLEDRAMQMAESGQRHRPWACNGKSLRVGEIILIIDADTIVPEDCFRDAAREMYESPDLAIIQHESDVMQVANHYFENGITHFTRRINRCISYGCANGEVAPFVGHNAFLRWSAMQDAAFIDSEDSIRKIWSEANVSEDFDMALRLLLGGYTLRWATYSNGGFKEGVSLTVVDELARWQKYAYGCDEIIFNPIIRWWRKGPISDQLRGFVWSQAPVHYKVGMMSYGIAAATFGSIMNYLLLGLGPEIDRFYLHSFEILLACTVVFPGLGNLGFTLLEYRLGHRNFFAAMVENLRWVPFFLFFFGGLSIHLSTAILAHLCSYDMQWGSTGKEVERSTFWIEVPRIWHGFKLTFIICFAIIVMMIVFTSPVVPFEWQINGWNYAIIIPLSLVVGSHILLPIVLNPWLMIFSY